MGAVTASSSRPGLLTQQLRERRFADQMGRLILAVVLTVTALTFIVVPFQAYNWLQIPFLGAILEYPKHVNYTQPVLPSSRWTGLDAGLQVRETITAIDGQPVDTAQEIYTILRQRQVGESVSLTVLEPDGATRTVEVELMRMPLGDALTLFAVPYVIGLLYLAIGLWVYRNRRDQPLGRVFVMMCSSVALVLGATFDIWTTQTFIRLWTAAIPWGAGMAMIFAMIFPTEAAFVARRPSRHLWPILPSLILLTWAQWQLGQTQSHDVVLRAWRFEYYYTGLGIMIFIVSLFLRAIFAASPSVREQSRVVLVGAAVSFAPFILWTINETAIPIVLVLMAFLFFPLVIAYSIVQYSVLDTGRALSFTTTYAIMGGIVVIGYALLVSGISLISTAAIGEIAANPVLIGLVTFLLVLGFQPVRRRLQETLDRFFFRTRSEYQERLTAFRHELTLASGLSEIVRLLKQHIRETLMPTHTYVFLRDPQIGNFIAAGEGARPDTDIRFEAQSGLVHALSTTRDVVFLELNKPLPPELIEEHARLAVLRTPVLAPLQGQLRLAGWVAVGNKRSGEAFSIHDLRFIQALAEQAALAVERAQAIGDLERRVRELDVLSQVSQAVNFTQDPDVLMELIYTQTSKLIDTTNFYIIMRDPQLKTLSYAFFLENDQRVEQREGEGWPDDLGLAAQIVRTGTPLRTDDYAETCAQRGVRPLDRQHRAWMGVPLNAGNTTLGAMIVASFTPGVIFTDEQLKVFWAIADQAATALDKARLFREIETSARQLATLNEISKELSSTLDLESVLRQIMRRAVDILTCEAGSLFLIDENTGELVFRVVEGGAKDLVGTRLPPGKGIVGESAQKREPVISNNVLQDRRWFSEVDRETAFQTQSLLAVPLLVQDQSIGVLEVINKRDGTPFDDEDAALLTTFAAQAAIAIDNARLYEATDAELAARVDELQNLQRIDRELNRTLNFDRVIRITLDWALRTTGASAGMLGMINIENNSVDILSSTGYRPELLEQYTETGVPLEMGIVGRVLSSGKPEFVEEVKHDPDYSAFAQEESVSQIAVPILRVNQPIGVLVLESHIPNLLTMHDYEFVQRLVEHAAVAIENARLIQEIEDANRSKTEFISFVAHELKNPMTSIRGYTDLLKSGQVGDVSDMQVQFLGTIRSNVDRMTRLVSDLADVARIETGHLRLEMSPISVKDVIDETLRGLQSQIEEKEQELVIEIPNKLPFIFADHTRMVQVLTNLVSNAHKYTPEGGKIWVGAQAETITDEESGEPHEVVHHWVRDTGIGMTEDEVEQLFQKFYRTQRGKDMAQGTGLGLNITKSLVARHQGRIWVESEVGAGTTFHYTIPVATAEETQMQQAAD